MSAPTTYRRPVSRLWWLKKRTYLLFLLRELSCVFVAWSVVFMMMLIYAIGRGEASYQRFLDWAASPVVVVVNVVALAFLVLHTVTWFALTPQAMVVRAPPRPAGGGDQDGPRRGPDRAGGDRGSGRWPGAGGDGDRLAVRRTCRGVGVHRLAGDPVTKRRIAPILWLLFSAGGVMAAVFLPVLVVLFGLAIPLGWVQPDYNHLDAIVSHWFTRLVVLGLFVLMLFHWAHRFKYTMIDGLRIASPREADHGALLRRCAARIGRHRC